MYLSKKELIVLKAPDGMHTTYSYLNESTGFLIAAKIV